MNFLSAIKHAVIGYGIRRKIWDDWMILHLDHFGELRWVNGNPRKEPACVIEGNEAKLLDDEFGVSAEDILAKDWETV